MKKIIVLFALLVSVLSLTHAHAFNLTDFGVNFQAPNVTAETVYLPDSGEVTAGAGVALASWKDLILKALYIAPTDSTKEMAGLAISLDLTKFVSINGGAWLLGTTGITIGISGVTNLNGKADIEPAITASIKVFQF